MRAHFALGVLVAVSAAACDDSNSTSTISAGGGAPSSNASTTTDTSSSSGTGGGTCASASQQVVPLTTDDGVQLEGDLYTTGTKGGAGVVLLHMIPPSNDRSNYPPSFIDKLTAEGLNVLNIDRRGGGASAGVAMDAYSGPNGKLDAKAAVTHLLDHDCAIDPSRVALVGASNGTTTALDYTIAAQGELSYQLPGALVFLTGGDYTENQNSVSGNKTLLDTLPIQLVFSTDESAWSAQFEADAPAIWQIVEYADGAHGTNIFNAAPESMDAVANFLAGALAPG